MSFRILFIFLVVTNFSFAAKSETLIILERSGTLTFTQVLTQDLQQSTFGTPVHIAYVDAFYASLSDAEKADASNLYYKSIMLSAGIDKATHITRIISQGSAPGLFLEKHPDFFATAERIFTHILWQPITGKLVPSDLDLNDALRHILTLFPTKSQLLLVGNYQAFSNYLTDIIFEDKAKVAQVVDIVQSDYEKSAAVNSIQAVSSASTVALLTHPPETKTELDTLQYLQKNNIPVLFMFANDLDLLEHKNLGGLVVSPQKISSLIKKLVNDEAITKSDQQVSTPLYHADALDKFNIDPDVFSDNYRVVGRDTYSHEEVQFIIQLSLVISVVLLVLYITMGLKNRRLLKERAQLAEQANLDKDQLMANISHELRTPLNAIHLAFEALNEATAAQSSNIIDAGQRATQHLKNTVNIILDYQKSSKGEMEVELNWVDKANLVQAIRIHQYHASKKSLSFHIDGIDDLPRFIHTDEKLITQILHNILSNALKFTEQGGISMTFSHVVDRLIIEITDTGIGMDQATIDQLFVPFKQANSGNNKKYQGTGLGMALCSKQVSLLGGHIQIDSQLNKGTQLLMSLPVRWRAELETEVSKTESIDYLPLSVLVVEDDALSRELICFMLKNRVLRLLTAESAKDALTVVNGYKFDVVLTDIQMPEMDGVALFTKLRQQYPLLPIIAVTGNALENDRQTYLDLGFNAVVAKPFNIQDIMQQLKRLEHEPSLAEHND